MKLLLLGLFMLTQDGRTLYHLHCADCHGIEGKGDGPGARDLEQDPGDLSKPINATDAELVAYVSKGSGDMPGFGNKLTAEELGALVGYVRLLDPPQDGNADKLPPLAELAGRFVITGYATAGYDGDSNRFGASFNPIFLFRPVDRLLVESELEFEIGEEEDLEVFLEYAQVSYLLNSYVTLGAGKFLNPASPFEERYHPAWINRLPDSPLLHDAGLMPEAITGVQMRGAATRWLRYAAFIGNSETEEEPVKGEEPSDYRSSYGGRLGVLPIAGAEFGASIFSQEVGDVYGADAGFSVGDLSLLGQVNWDEEDADSEYVQASYRIADFEPVVRWDRLSTDETVDRWTYGLDTGLLLQRCSRLPTRLATTMT